MQAAQPIGAAGPEVVGEGEPRKSSGDAVGRHPQHVGDSLAQLDSSAPMRIDITPRVIQGSDRQARQIASKQLEHLKASRSPGASSVGIYGCGAVGGDLRPQTTEPYLTGRGGQPDGLGKLSGVRPLLTVFSAIPAISKIPHARRDFSWGSGCRRVHRAGQPNPHFPAG